MFNLHKETYQIDSEPCTVVADFEQETIKIMARGFNQTYSMNEYTNFEGNMLDFATSKVIS